jgi:hypothetical protein
MTPLWWTRRLIMAAATTSPPKYFRPHRRSLREAIDWLAPSVFLEVLPACGAFSYTGWRKAVEAPLLHHRLTKAQFALEIAEMYLKKLCWLVRSALCREASVFELIRTRAWLGQVATHARACVAGLFEASAASQVMLDADLQRYFRDVNVLHQHGLVREQLRGALRPLTGWARTRYRKLLR